MKETAEERKCIEIASKRSLDIAENTKKKLTHEVAQLQEQNAEIKEQAKIIDGHDKLLDKHNHDQLSVMKVKETNVASSVSYAIKEIGVLSQDQKRSSQQLKETQECVSHIANTGRQLNEQVTKLTKHLSVTEEKRDKQVNDLVKQISSMQQQLQETTSELK